MYYPQRTKRTHQVSPRDRLISALVGVGLFAVAIRISKVLRIPLILGSGLFVFAAQVATTRSLNRFYNR